MTLEEALWQDPERLSGAVCFRGTRVPLRTLIDHLEAGELQEFYEGFPNVTPEMVVGVIEGLYSLFEKEFTLRKSA